MELPSGRFRILTERKVGVPMKLGTVIYALTSLAMVAPGVMADEWTRTWNVGAQPELRVDADDAAVTVEASDTSEIRAKLTTKGWTIGPSGVQVSGQQSGSSLEIRVKVPNEHFNWGNRSIRLEVFVPRKLNGEIRTGDGSVSVRGVSGDLRVNTGDGSIDVAELSGKLDMHTGDGSIHLRDVHGDLRVNTGDGSVNGEGLAGSLDAHTGDGAMRVSGRFNDLRLRTGDGSIDLAAQRGSQVRSEWEVRTQDGGVTLHVPGDLAANLQLHTGDGSIRLNMPLTVSGVQNEHQVSGKLNGGGQLVTVSSGNGSITMSSI
jgi:DUF4097 and DUF4098 domain-containing protein YvlB